MPIIRNLTRDGRLTILLTAFAIALTSPQTLHAASTELTVSVDGVQRQAIVFPPNAKTEGKVPVILAFHGHGGSPNAFAQNAKFEQAWPEALVVYPQGIPLVTDVDPKGEKPGWQRKPGEIGNRDLKFVDALLAKLRELYPVDDQHVFAVGFSNGAFFTYLLWAERPQTFAGFAPVAGRSDLSGTLKVPKPAVQVGGRADQTVHLADVEKAMATVRELNGCSESGQPCGPGCVRYSSTKNAPVIDWIHPGPHMFPPRATPLIINFFKEISGAAPTANNSPNEPAKSEAPAPEASAATSIQPGSTIQRIPFDGAQRTYRLHIPTGYDGTTPLPLVLVLHGRGGNGLGMEKGTGMSAKADQEHFIVAYPNALGQPPVWSSGLIPGVTGTADDVGFIRALIDHLESTLKIDPKRIYSCGLSSGAIMSYRLGAELSDRLAAVGIAAGTIGATLTDGSEHVIAHPANPVAVIHFHGKKDGVIHYNGGGQFGNCFPVARSIAFWVKANGCSQPPHRSTQQGGNVTIEDYNRCSDGGEVVLYTFANGGHEWPTLQNNEHFSATDAMWEFFVKHPKP